MKLFGFPFRFEDGIVCLSFAPLSFSHRFFAFRLNQLRLRIQLMILLSHFLFPLFLSLNLLLFIKNYVLFAEG